MLARVDRFGFFDQAEKARSESRISLIPISSFKTVPKLPRTAPDRTKIKTKRSSGTGGSGSQARPSTPDGPKPVPPETIDRLTNDLSKKSSEKEQDRVNKWQRMITVSKRDTGGNAVRWQWDNGGKGRKWRKRVYKGIPDRWRMAAWAAMIETRQERQGSKSPSLMELNEIYKVSLVTLLGIVPFFD